MPTPDSIAFVSNTITRVFAPYLNEFNLTHYPLDTIIETLHSSVKESYCIILLDYPFFLEHTEHEKVMEHFERFQKSLESFRGSNSTKIILNTIAADFTHPFFAANTQTYITLAALNHAIALLPEKISDCAIIDLFTLTLQEGSVHLTNPKNRYLFQTPWNKKGVEKISQTIKEAIATLTQPRLKAIAVDADNTLWSGIIGEDGIDGIQIDRNYPGIAYRRFQEQLLALKATGIILILLSKNDLHDIEETFAQNNMPLSLADFTAVKVNWESKSANLLDILATLGIGKESVIFLDDSPAEIEEMRSRLGIESFRTNPADPLGNLTLLQSVPSLKTFRLTDEDLRKSDLYKEEASRNTLHEQLGSREAFIASLEIEIFPYRNNPSHIGRAAQLIGKTNQFNLTTKRYSEHDVSLMMGKHDVYTFEVRDKFGSMGIVGVLIVIDRHIDTFLMSCRVLGRGIEESILSFVASRYETLRAAYSPTSKNTLVASFYENNGFERIGDGNEKIYRLVTMNPPHSSIKVHPCPSNH